MSEDYLIRSAECVVLGNFTDEVTVLGVGVQIVLGIFDLDLPCDIRDQTDKVKCKHSDQIPSYPVCFCKVLYICNDIPDVTGQIQI